MNLQNGLNSQRVGSEDSQNSPNWIVRSRVCHSMHSTLINQYPAKLLELSYYFDTSKIPGKFNTSINHISPQNWCILDLHHSSFRANHFLEVTVQPNQPCTSLTINSGEYPLMGPSFWDRKNAGWSGWLVVVACCLLFVCRLVVVVVVLCWLVGCCCCCGCWLLVVSPENTHGDLFLEPQNNPRYIPYARSKLVSKLCYVPKFKNIKIKPTGCSSKVLISLAAGRLQDRSSCKLTWQWNIQHFHGIV